MVKEEREEREEKAIIFLGNSVNRLLRSSSWNLIQVLLRLKKTMNRFLVFEYLEHVNHSLLFN